MGYFLEPTLMQKHQIKDYVTVQADRFEYVNIMAVLKLPVNSHVLLSLYQLYSHTFWIAGKH